MIRAAKIAFFSSVFVLAACQSQSANQAGEASSERAERGEITLASFNEDGSLKQIITYKDGVPADPKLADKETKFLDDLEKNMGKIEVTDITGTIIK